MKVSLRRYSLPNRADRKNRRHSPDRASLAPRSIPSKQTTAIRMIMARLTRILAAGLWLCCCGPNLLAADEPASVVTLDSQFFEAVGAAGTADIAVVAADQPVEFFAPPERIAVPPEAADPLPEGPPQDGLAAQLRAMQKRIDELEAAQKKSAADGGKKGEKEKPAAKPTGSEFPTFKVTGFLQLDSVFYSQDNLNQETVGDGQDGTGFRRARLAVNGRLAEFTNYQIEVDFANAGRPSFFDCFVEQGNIPYLGTVKVGHFCQPFSVDSLTGFRNLTFLERALPFLAFVPFRRVGAQAQNNTEDEMTSWAYSVYRAGGYQGAPIGDDRFATDVGDIGGYAVSGRMTHLLHYDPHANDRYLWHVGGGYNFSVLGANDEDGSTSSTPFYQARTTPEFGPLGLPEIGTAFGSGLNITPIFVDTGRYQARNFHLAGLETVWQSGPMGFTAEYMTTFVDSVAGPVFYHGAYAQFAYRLTGENRAYDKKTGTLGKLVPYTDFIPLKKDGIVGWGAWEVAARYSFVDLRNPAKLNGHFYNAGVYNGARAPGAGILHDTTLGLTWFLNTHTQFHFNWIHAFLDNQITGRSDADLFVTRVHWDF